MQGSCEHAKPTIPTISSGTACSMHQGGRSPDHAADNEMTANTEAMHTGSLELRSPQPFSIMRPQEPWHKLIVCHEPIEDIPDIPLFHYSNCGM